MVTMNVGLMILFIFFMILMMFIFEPLMLLYLVELLMFLLLFLVPGCYGTHCAIHSSNNFILYSKMLLELICYSS